MSKILLFGVLVVLVAISIMYWVNQASPNAPIVVSEGAEALINGEAESDAGARVRELILGVDISGEAKTLAVDSAEIDESDSPSDRPSRISHQDSLRAHYEALVSEPRDPNWAPIVEDQIQSVLAVSTIPSREVEAICRTSICRAVIRHPFELPQESTELPWNFSDYLRSLDLIVQQDPRVNTVVFSTAPENGVDPSIPKSEWGELVTTIYIFDELGSTR